ncbi:MAG: bifunctional precorrin-2 dehydrogenase/sirohydrochlorin ferrochelatase [Armatimonadota bacterium]|nr:bifunctional precorrin-2 dehydrogenase/sirohydrochlorin ferrochelatase [bacterium]
MGYYPIVMDLTEKKCLIVGGGRVALRKAVSLIEAGAAVTVISPDIDDDLDSLDGVTNIRREYASGDASGYALIFAATDDTRLNSEVSNEAARNGIPVNVVDDPELCTFIVPALVRRGDLMISVTTSGKSPMLSKMIRQELEEAYGPEYEAFVDLLGEVRYEVKSRYTSAVDREAAFTRLINSGIFEMLRSGRKKEARETAHRCI